MHEAGHQFGYENPHGMTEGCGNSSTRCHDHYGSGGIMSHDDRIRIDVTPEDVEHVRMATWNDSARGDHIYAYRWSGDRDAVDDYGIWMRHDFDIDGWVHRPSGRGEITDYVNAVTAAGYVDGTPSTALPPASATYDGDFLGIDLGTDCPGALLRARARLRYTLDSRKMDVRISGFEAHYHEDGFAAWRDHDFSDWGDFTYRMDCSAGGCSGDGIESRWYAGSDGDPTGHAGGVVDDAANAYAGSFMTEKDSGSH